jgi:hypothetical protein
MLFSQSAQFSFEMPSSFLRVKEFDLKFLRLRQQAQEELDPMQQLNHHHRLEPCHPVTA